MTALDFEAATRHRISTKRGTLSIRKKRDAAMPRTGYSDLPAAEQHRRKLNAVYKTLRLAAKAKGKKFPPYEYWLSHQPTV